MIFLITSIVVFNLIAFLIPKRMTKIEMFSTCLFALLFQKTTDIILFLGYDLYGYITKGVSIINLIPTFGLYPAFNIIILNYFPFTKNIRTKAYYILIWSAFLVAFEWSLVKTGTFYHNGWKYWHSALAYPIIIIILIWCLSFVRRINKSNK